MKTLFNYPFVIYMVAGIACLCIMIIIDYVLGAEAEHLNAWVIINQMFGQQTSAGDSLAIRALGLPGAAFLMLAANTFFGVILIQFIKLIIRIVHS
ncbi:MAG: hypothetical protein R8N23_00815 [Reichenbachiella sp.]|uniref:hypothetical protein n=1 Tax=Reichenbachiella sp. TaxID=2184521 RepID=UPI002965F281|nr:hypothetical protein [Reichenbachiella sp.]MDW3208376.1 hypothetical protein [Reichenbachiella sp.]